MPLEVPVTLKINPEITGGIAAGVAAGGTLALIDAIGSLIKQSKILSMFTETVGKAMGLLIDLILLPFLPIITWVLIRLFQVIMLFHKLWDSTMKTYFQPLIDAIVHFDPLGKGPKGGWTIDTAALALALISGLIVAISAISLSGLAEVIIIGIFYALGAIATSSAMLPIAIILLAALTAAIVYYASQWAYDLGKQAHIILAPIRDEIRSFLWGIVIEFWKAVDGLWEAFSGIISAFAGFAAQIILGFKRIWWWILNDLKSIPLIGLITPEPGAYPQAASGGYVGKTGLAVIHKGETITPNAGITVIINGTYQNDEDLYKKFIDKIRRDQWRQNV